jgi:surface antigen
MLTLGCFAGASPVEAARSSGIVHRVTVHRSEHLVRAQRSHAESEPARTAHRRGGSVRHASAKHSLSKNGKARYAGGANLQCVPFARALSGIAIKGNAVNWWDAAAGVYQRGHRPEVGSVLNFRATENMRLGHVAVVREIVNSREVLIDQANWSGGGRKGNITRGQRVIDVSQNNDWTAVRVALGNSDTFGSLYPTYGFIYDRPDDGRIVPNTLAYAGLRKAQGGEEVAEAPAHPRVHPLSLGTPGRSLR